ncbi:hypothetical protein F0562_015472 [Nyssa sinensis]|uniref:Uncharacterized protein n=1 Tax=Nyssa sinensis TaxID=561372 RepID=A0A5J4ZKD5_9ASTE|nr:hypothetical protein F0562_015472 [Nyssa sinensis]
MSSGEDKKVSSQDIQLVQNLIERCLRHYMSQKEVETTLLVKEKIEPSVTELVWQKLEEENQEFFKAYSLRLIVKEQIINFNRLLVRQVELMHQIYPTGATSIPMSNGSHIPPSKERKVSRMSAIRVLEDSTGSNGGAKSYLDDLVGNSVAVPKAVVIKSGGM